MKSQSKPKKAKGSADVNDADNNIVGNKSRKIQSKLNDEERVWVIALENAIREARDLDRSKISDWDVACHAIVAKNDTDKAILRLRRLLKFRTAYNVPEHPSVYEAMKSVHDFIDQHPDFINALGKDALGRWILHFQLTGLTSVPYPTIENKFTAIYFLFGAVQPDLDAVRAGTIWIGDLRDLRRENLPMVYVNASRALCRDSFPVKIKDVLCLNSPPRLSAVYAMCRPFFSPSFQEKLIMNCKPELLRKHFPSRFLSSVSMGGNQKRNEILDVLEENLKRRFDNQLNFRLNLF